MEIQRFKLESSAFKNGETIPDEFTAEGENASPPLHWEAAPKDTKSFVLICEDPDAPANPPYIHWVVYDIPPNLSDLESTNAQDIFHDEFLQGKNSAGSVGYTGPKPPAGSGTHRYYFSLYALDKKLKLPAGASKGAILDAMRDHILAEAEFVGKRKH